MVFAAPLESNEMPPWPQAADQGFQEELPRGMSHRFRSGAFLETGPIANAQGLSARYSAVDGHTCGGSSLSISETANSEAGNSPASTTSIRSPPLSRCYPAKIGD
jgi:hypothetical protein